MKYINERAQRIVEKNGVIHLIMFTSRGMALKMSKWLISPFSANYSKKLVPVWEILVHGIGTKLILN